LSIALAGADDRLDIQWQPERGYAIERVQFADGTIWDRNMLESQAAPDTQGDRGSGAGDGVPASGDGHAPAGGGASQAGGDAAPAPDGGAVASASGTGAPSADVGAAAADSGSTSANVGTPTASHGSPSTDPGASAADHGAPQPQVSAQAGGGKQSGTISGRVADPGNAQSATGASQHEAFAAALRQFGALEATTAPAPARSASKSIDLSDAQSVSGYSAAALGAAASFSALQPAQPDLQRWLDNWVGPSARAGSARAGSGAREASEASSNVETGQPSSVPEPSNLQNEFPDAQPAETLTPEQIGQSYADIEIWLAANPGIERDLAGAGGSMPDRNLFIVTGSGSGCASDAGAISMPGFGETPGMAVIAGGAMQALRGLREGYTPLGVL
jgi:hypothetical protein